MIRHLMRHARNIRHLKYDKALFRMFVKKPNVALKSILRTAMGTSTHSTLPTDLSTINNEATWLLIITPSRVVNKITKLETVALFLDPTLPMEASFPWLGLVRPTPTSSIPLIPGQITPAISHEAPRYTPNHKAAGPDGVPGLVLKYMPRISTRLSTSSFRPSP